MNRREDIIVPNVAMTKTSNVMPASPQYIGDNLNVQNQGREPTPTNRCLTCGTVAEHLICVVRGHSVQ